MRSVITILFLLIVLSGILFYMTGRYKVLLDGFYGGGSEEGPRRRGWETGGSDTSIEYGWSWLYGFIPYYGSIVVEQPISLESEAVLERPCATDLDCPVGHCSMVGICTTGFTL
jgi:hypothetical protein